MDDTQHIWDLLSRVEQVADLLKNTFVAKDELIDLMVTSALAQEHLLIVGPPGTAKSELIKRFALLCTDGEANYFEYLLTRFTEPNEIFGPVNIAAFREGHGAMRNVTQMLPSAEVAFLDEVFKANSAILNALLTILNERLFYNGGQRQEVPLLFAVGATNSVPDDEQLGALYDRFLLRYWTDNVEESRFDELFQRGWRLERNRLIDGYNVQLQNILTTNALCDLNQALAGIDLDPIGVPYREVVRRLRSEGVKLSDRRVIKLLKLIAASALRRKADAANPGDFWVLRHVWNDQEQIPHLQNIVNEYVDAFRDDAVGTERGLTDIEGSLLMLEGQIDHLTSDIDFVDHLQQLEALRRELMRHSGSRDNAPNETRELHGQLQNRTNAMIEQLMQMLERQL